MNALRRLRFLDIKCPWKYCITHGKRHLFSPASLGIDNFISHRQDYPPNAEVFKQRLRQICDINSDSLVLLDDVRKVLFFTKTEEDLGLLLDLLKKYCSQKDVMLFQPFNFGPEVMRLLHIMNKPKEAIKLVEDENQIQYFQNYSTGILLLDMLFENKMYNEVIRCYEYYRDKVNSYIAACHTGLGLVFLAACLKLNTPESFEKALHAHVVGEKKKKSLPLRQSLYFAALAINQNQPHWAIKMLTVFRSHNVAENYKLMAYAKAKRFEYITESLNRFLEWTKRSNFFITNEALSFVEKELQNEESFIQEFKQLKENLAAKNFIVNEPLENYLFREINVFQRKKSSSSSSFSQLNKLI